MRFKLTVKIKHQLFTNFWWTRKVSPSNPCWSCWLMAQIMLKDECGGWASGFLSFLVLEFVKAPESFHPAKKEKLDKKEKLKTPSTLCLYIIFISFLLIYTHYRFFVVFCVLYHEFYKRLPRTGYLNGLTLIILLILGKMKKHFLSSWSNIERPRVSLETSSALYLLIVKKLINHRLPSSEVSHFWCIQFVQLVTLFFILHGL